MKFQTEDLPFAARPGSQECPGITRPSPFLRSEGSGGYQGSQNSQEALISAAGAAS